MKRFILSLWLVVLADVSHLEAHAFLERAEPAVGSRIQTSPPEVRVWFTEKVEPTFSTIQVFDANGKEIDKHDTHPDRSNQAVLHVSLPPLPSGTYKVVWRVVSIDTHVTNGKFTFQIGR
jgi:copper resistance protein C